jgi:hypothetical protein
MEDQIKTYKEDLCCLAKLYPYKGDKSLHKLPVDDSLPSVFCGIQPGIFETLRRTTFSGPNGEHALEEKLIPIFENFCKAQGISIPDYNLHQNLRHKWLRGIELVRNMLDDTDTIDKAKTAGSNRVAIEALINDVKGKYPDYYELVPDWLKEKIGNSLNFK